MNSINTLPDELLLNIIQFIQPDDLVAFVCTQRRLHSLSVDRLAEHRQKRKTYRHIIITDVDHEANYDSKENAYSHPRHFFADIQRDPFILFYPRTLQWDCLILPDSEDDQDVVKDSAFFRDLIRRILALEDVQAIERLEKGDVEACLLLILLLLPNLNCLKLEQDGADPSITEVRQRILEHSKLCSNLKRVESHNFDEEYTELQWLKPWTALPAIQSLAGSRYTSYASTGEIVSRLQPTMSSMPDTLQAIELIECEVDGRDLAMFLDGLRNLRSFYFLHAITFNTHWEWNTTAFMNALEESSVQTLVDLTLLFERAPSDQIASLKNFKSLRSFCGNTEMLPHRISNSDDSDHQLLQLDLQACFPPSISKLSLSAHDVNDDRVSCPWLVTFENITDCDQLKRIVLASDVASTASISIMAQHGIEYKVRSLLDPEADEVL
ncbi:hypothetical protein MRB53_040168 [Persea americana]|nr:hypothetical protein MRB53_040168 [Persea americana]